LKIPPPSSFKAEPVNHTHAGEGGGRKKIGKYKFLLLSPTTHISPRQHVKRKYLLFYFLLP
jgi:hypothetical protein